IINEMQKFIHELEKNFKENVSTISSHSGKELAKAIPRGKKLGTELELEHSTDPKKKYC
ncbi:hypothetical protein HAX54_037001, partial [Datura stramonium]|nr:hypothetical protein [Datura stramonium]